MTTNLPVELSGYQAAAADLARIVADLRVLPGAEKPPYLALSILPEKSVEAVDTVALAVLGKRGATRRDSDGWRHIAEGRVGAVFVSVHAVVPGPPDERDLELESLRAEVEELRADRVGQLYSREADDPTPVSGARVEPHVGGMTEGGLVDETPAPQVVRYFSFGHGQTDPDTGENLLDKYVVVFAPTAEACREAMLASRFGREWAFEYVPGTPQANEWIPRWTEHDAIDAMPEIDA